MRKIIASEFITLDGVVEAPGGGDVSLPGKRGWSEPFMVEEIGQVIMGQMMQSDAMLLGSKTYQEFAAFWPNVPDTDPFGQFMNNQAKYVVSTTLKSADWKNSTLLNGNFVDDVTKLKSQPGKNITVTGSPTLVVSLLQHGLLDELQLLLCPVVLGVGKRLFKESDQSQTLKLVDSKTFSSGAVLLSYAPGA